MADVQRSSFLPKETMGFTPNNIRRRRTFHVFGFLATASLIGSLVLAGGVYFLKSSAESSLSRAQEALSAQKSLFTPEHITEVKDFDRRLRAAEALINNHVSPLKVFSALEEATKQRVQYTSFSLSHEPSQEVSLSLSGVSPEFKTLALQEVELADNQFLRNIVVEEITLGGATAEETEGSAGDTHVAFTLAGTIDLGSIRSGDTSVESQEVEPMDVATTPVAPEEVPVVEENVLPETASTTDTASDLNPQTSL